MGGALFERSKSSMSSLVATEVDEVGGKNEDAPEWWAANKS